MDGKHTWSRRKFSKAAISAQVLLSSGLVNFVSGCSPSDSKDTIDIESINNEILKTAMDQIVPASDTMPSASGVGGVEYILSVLQSYPDLIATMVEILNNIEQLTQKTHQKKFVDVSSEQRTQTLSAYESTHSELFSILRNFVYESYYVNEKVWKLIGYEPYPTLSPGPQMEPFDPNLLERVKNLPQSYINPNS